jgi:DNA-3-methyladenine glycosylase I
MKVQEEFGSFSKYIWSFVDHEPQQNVVTNYKEAPATTPTSDLLSKDLKKRGFKFVGSTVIYAHMQATGMVNDHEISCFRYEEVRSL